MRLIYIADPMCSWCYGFGPELSKLLARHPDATVDVVMGGLRPFNTQPTTAEFRAMGTRCLTMQEAKSAT